MKLDYFSIKRKLEHMQCTEHGEHPKVSFKNGNLSAECCCETFRTKILRRAEKLFVEETHKAIDQGMKRMFK